MNLFFFSRNIFAIDDEGIDLSGVASCADSISSSNISALSVTSSLSSIIHTSDIINQSHTSTSSSRPSSRHSHIMQEFMDITGAMRHYSTGSIHQNIAPPEVFQSCPALSNTASPLVNHANKENNGSSTKLLQLGK